jgi:hypothetical protein
MEGRRKKSRVNTEKEKRKKKGVMDDGFSSSFTDITLFFFFLYDVLIGKPWYLSLVYLVETLPAVFYVGCSGGSYDAWLGHFYPANLEWREFLRY